MDNNSVVLIIDDTVTNLAILSECLKGNYQIITANNGKDGINIAQQQPKPDLILLDIEMPGLSGYQVCKLLKENPSTSDIPIIFVTGKSSLKDEEKGFNLGAVDYITKPIHPEIVLARSKAQITLKKQTEKLEKMALFDQLTNMYNRHFFLEAAKKRISAAVEHQFPLSAMMIDIDLFKLINDQHGHIAGDSVIKSIGKLLNNEYKNENIAARFGGEEFVVLLDHCKVEEAFIEANKLRQKIEELNPINLKVTVSIGVSELINNERSFNGLLDRADQSLYLAKEQGRNRVVQYKS